MIKTEFHRNLISMEKREYGPGIIMMQRLSSVWGIAEINYKQSVAYNVF